MSAAALEAIDIAAYGPVVLGEMFGAVLYGAITISACFYLGQFKRDPWYNKAAVGLVWLMCTASFVIGVVRVWQVAVSHAGDLNFVSNMRERPTEWLYLLSACGTTLLCQVFLIIRINMFSRAMLSVYGPRRRIEAFYVVPVLSVLIWLNGAVATVATTIELANLSSLNDVLNTSAPGYRDLLFHSTWLCASLTFTDLCIAVKMTVQLWTARTGFGASNRVLRSLITLVLLNFTAVLSVGIALLVTVTSKDTSWVEFCVAVVGDIHALSQIAILMQPRLAHQRYFAQSCGASFGDVEPGLSAHIYSLGSSSGAGARGKQPTALAPPDVFGGNLVVLVNQASDGTSPGGGRTYTGSADSAALHSQMPHRPDASTLGPRRVRRGQELTFFEALDSGLELDSCASSEAAKGAGSGQDTPNDVVGSGLQQIPFVGNSAS